MKPSLLQRQISVKYVNSIQSIYYQLPKRAW